MRWVSGVRFDFQRLCKLNGFIIICNQKLMFKESVSFPVFNPFILAHLQPKKHQKTYLFTSNSSVNFTHFFLLDHLHLLHPWIADRSCLAIKQTNDRGLGSLEGWDSQWLNVFEAINHTLPFWLNVGLCVVDWNLSSSGDFCWRFFWDFCWITSDVIHKTSRNQKQGLRRLMIHHLDLCSDQLEKETSVIWGSPHLLRTYWEQEKLPQECGFPLEVPFE